MLHDKVMVELDLFRERNPVHWNESRFPSYIVQNPNILPTAFPCNLVSI